MMRHAALLAALLLAPVLAFWPISDCHGAQCGAIKHNTSSCARLFDCEGAKRHVHAFDNNVGDAAFGDGGGVGLSGGIEVAIAPELCSKLLGDTHARVAAQQVSARRRPSH